MSRRLLRGRERRRLGLLLAVALGEIVLGPADAGRRLPATVDDTLVVRLPDTPMGYVWDFEGDAPSFTVLESRMEPTEEDAVGAAPTQVLVLRPTSPGTHLLDLSLRRPWEPEGEPVERLSMTVDVQGR